MSIEKHEVDGFYVKHQLNCDSYIQTSYGLFISNMLITGEHSLTVYYLKEENVPAYLQAFGVVDAGIASRVVDWFDYALNKGYATSLKQLFPKHNIVLDFDRQDLTDQLKQDVAELQSQVTALDATFSTDIERQAAVTNLQNQIDSNDTDIAQEIQDRADAIVTEVLARDAKVEVEKLRAEAEEKAIQDDVDANQLAGENDRQSIRTAFADGDQALLGGASGTHDTLAKLEVYINNEGGYRSTADQAATTDRQSIRDAFAQADSDLVGSASSQGNTLKLLEDRLALQEATYSDLNVDDAITAAKDELLGAPSDALNTLQELGEALNNDDDYAASITTLLSAKAPKSSPVFSGTHAVFQSGLQISSGQTCQGKQFVGNDSVTLRSIVDGNVILSAHGSGVVTCDSNIQVTGVVEQNGYACLDTNSSIVSDVAGKQIQLDAGELAVVAGDPFNSSNYTLSATIASAVLVEKNRALAAEGGLQIQLDAGELAVIAGEVYSTAEKQKVTDAETKLASISSIGSGQILTSDERVRLNTTHVDLHTNHSATLTQHASDLAGKQDTLNTTHLAIDTVKSHVGIREQNPETILEIPYKNSDDKCVWLGHRGLNQAGNVATDTADAEHRTLMLGSRPSGAWATLGFQVQNTDKATIDYNAGEMSFYIFDSSTSAWDLALQLRKDGGVHMPNLPTSPSGLATGQLYNASGFVKIVE